MFHVDASPLCVSKMRIRFTIAMRLQAAGSWFPQARSWFSAGVAQVMAGSATKNMAVEKVDDADF